MPKKILIIDDETELVNIVKIRLEASGYEVESAVSGEAAFGWLTTHTPDLILLDLLLPEMRGEDVCRRLKSNRSLKHIPVILFTASVSNVPELVRRVGADDYISKPYDPKDLIKKISKYIEKDI